MASSSSSRARRSRSSARSSNRSGARMVFERRNYVLLLIGLGLIVLGYVLMRVENEVDGVLSLYVAPLLLLGGYLEIIYAILWRGSASEAAEPETNTNASAA